MNKRLLTIDEIKLREKYILEVFADFCELNNLKYYLTFGTLLGAVRHNGFIPWDDDIDVAMPRPDYNKMISILNKKNNLFNNTIELKTPYSPNFQYPISKVIDNSTFVHEPTMKDKYNTSLWIDIFPIDGLPENEKKAENMIYFIEKKRKFYFYTIEKKFSGKSIINKLKYNIIKFFLTPIYEIKKQNTIIDKLSQKFNFETSKQVAIMIDADAITSKMNKEELEQTYVTFENRKYTTFKNYDKFLRKVFHGDYMKLPPEEERFYKHSFDAYLIEE